MSEHDAPTLGPSTPTAQRARLTGWGLGPKTEAWVTSSADHDEVLAAVLRDPGDWLISVAKAGAIARGMGHSYGDAAMTCDRLVLDMTSLPGHEFDPEAGLVSAWAGETLRDLLRALVPRGWILPVVPGTQHVTVGGAIASDVHGKNHVRA